jgi:hypothetical protein
MSRGTRDAEVPDEAMPAIDRSMDFVAKSRNAQIALLRLSIFINLGLGELDCPAGILILLA